MCRRGVGCGGGGIQISTASRRKPLRGEKEPPGLGEGREEVEVGQSRDLRLRCKRSRAARSRLWFSRPDVGCALSEGDGRRAAGPGWEGFLLGLPGHMLSLQRAFWSTEALSAQFKSAGSLHSENPADHRTIEGCDHDSEKSSVVCSPPYTVHIQPRSCGCCFCLLGCTEVTSAPVKQYLGSKGISKTLTMTSC